MQTALAHPVFELKGVASRIDVSAWVSGVSLASGLLLAELSGAPGSIVNGGTGFYVLAGAYVAFLVTVLAIQRHMRLSLLANTFGSPNALVTSGIFRYSRNPIYVAYFLPLASLGFVSLSAAISAIGVYVVLMNATAIRKEERELLSVFGDKYAHYLTSTPRWVI